MNTIKYKESAQPLDRKAERSLYDQLADRLRRVLLEQYKAGDKIPTEEMLTAAYAISRVTVRRALQRLVDEGVLVRRAGKGTFIARALPQIVFPIDRLDAFFESFREQGESPTMEMLEVHWLEGEEIPAALRAAGKKALRFRRLYLSSGKPHVLATIALPEKVAERFNRADLERQPIYHGLERVLGLKVSRVDFKVSSVLASRDVAAALEVTQGTPLLLLERLSFSRGQLVEVGALHLLPEVYTLSVTVTAPRRAPRPRA